MKAIHKKMLVGGLALSAAVGYLAFASVRSGWVYYVDVAQFVNEAKYHSQRVKLSGTVGSEGLVSNPAGLTASFKLQWEGKSLPVVYHGVIPDLFAAERNVVVEGKLDSAGVFQADQLLTKCASKYEAQKAGGSPVHPAEIQRSANE